MRRRLVPRGRLVKLPSPLTFRHGTPRSRVWGGPGTRVCPGMRTLVTGGGGFIGSHVVDRLVAAGHEVAVVDLRPPHRADVGHIVADINDLDGLVEAFAGADVVFHLAAYADVNDVSRDPVEAT